MTPYRSAAASGSGVDAVVFGNRRRARVLSVVGVALVVASIALVVAWLTLGGGIRGSVLLPAIAGVALLLARTRWGSIGVAGGGAIGGRELVVKLSRVGVARETRIAFDDLVGVNVERVSGGEDFVLQLTLKGGRSVVLLRDASESALEPSRKVVSDFVLAQGFGAATATATERVRVAKEGTSVEAAAAVDDDDDGDDGDSLDREEEAKRMR